MVLFCFLRCSCCCRGQGGAGGSGASGGGGGHDSAFNSGGTPAVLGEFGAIGSTSLQSMTSEGRDSALALSEAKDDVNSELQMLQDTPGSFGSMVSCAFALDLMDRSTPCRRDDSTAIVIGAFLFDSVQLCKLLGTGQHPGDQLGCRKNQQGSWLLRSF